MQPLSRSEVRENVETLPSNKDVECKHLKWFTQKEKKNPNQKNIKPQNNKTKCKQNQQK